MFPLDAYSFFVGTAIFIISFTTYFTLLEQKFSRLKLFSFLVTSLGILFLSSKIIGSIGFWISTRELYWGPASVLGFYVLQVTYWPYWINKQPLQIQSSLLKRWALSIPLGLAFGRIGCHFAGCCFMNSTHLSWPLVEATYLSIIFLFMTYKKNHFTPPNLYRIYLYLGLGGRFFLDFMRVDHIRGNMGIFSFSQVLCLGLILWLFLDSQRRKGHNSGHEIRSRKS